MDQVNETSQWTKSTDQVSGPSQRKKSLVSCGYNRHRPARPATPPSLRRRGPLSLLEDCRRQKPHTGRLSSPHADTKGIPTKTCNQVNEETAASQFQQVTTPQWHNNRYFSKASSGTTHKVSPRLSSCTLSLNRYEAPVWLQFAAMAKAKEAESLLSWRFTSTEARWPIGDGDRVGRGR